MNDQQPDKQLLIAYFEGRLQDPHTRTLVEYFISSDKDPELVQACIQAVWEKTSDTPAAGTPADWDKFSLLAGIKPAKRSIIRPLMLAAATLLLLISVASFFIINKPHHAPAPLAWQEITANPAVIKKIQLPDGSELTIYPGSVARFNNEFNKTKRAIYLHGRAYFNIAPLAGKPFEVHTGSYTTEVLGTAFEVFEKPEQQQLAVTLVSGRVRITGEDRQAFATLQPDQQFTLHTDNNQFNVGTVSAKTMLSWVHGHLSFDQASLDEVCRDIAAWYGVRISIKKNTLLHKRVTAGFEGMPLETVMTILSQTAGFSFKAVNGNIEIY